MSNVNKRILLLTIIFLTFIVGMSNFVQSPTSVNLPISASRPGWNWSDMEFASDMSDLDSFHPESCYYDGYVYTVWTESWNIDGENDMDIFFDIRDTYSYSFGQLDVSSDSSEDSLHPAIYTNDNVSHFVWEENENDDGQNDQDIYYRSYEIGVGLSDTVVISTTSTVYYSWAPDIYVNSLGAVHIVWFDMDGYIYYSWRASRGLYFSTPENITPESNGSTYLPYITSDPEGNIFVTYLDSSGINGSGSDFDVFCKTRDKFTGEWSSPVLLTPTSDSPSIYYDFSFDSQGNSHLVFIDGSNGLYYTQKPADSDTWYPLELITDTIVSWVTLTADSWLNVYIMWTGSTQVFYRRWESINSVWTDTEEFAPGGESITEVDLELDDVGSIYATFSSRYDWDGGGSVDGSDEDIFLSKYTGDEVLTPKLAPLNPLDGTTGEIHLDWTDCVPVERYYIYRDTEPILSKRGLKPIVNTTVSEYVDTVTEENVYYYAIVGETASGSNSSISNCVNILVQFNPVALKELLIATGGVVGFQLVLFTTGVIISKKALKK